MRVAHALGVFKIGLLNGFKQTMAEKIIFLGSFLVYATIMLLYAGIIKLIPDGDLVKHGFTHAQMIWYLGITEYMLFTCTSWGFKEVQNEFWDGRSDFALLRPFPASLTRVAIWSGESLARALVLIVPSLAVLTALTGTVELSPLGLLGVIASMPMSILMMLCAAYMIGASCLWFVQAEPAFWIWQKSIFLLGPMVWPMAFYPLWLKGVMWASPFPGILRQAGQWAIGHSLAEIAFGFAHQLIWCALLFLIMRRFDSVVLRRVQTGGGG